MNRKSTYCGIYSITCISNRKVYIGSSLNITLRLRTHKCKLRGGRHENSYLQNAWNKYTEDKFLFSILKIVKPKFLHSEELKTIMHCKSNIRKFGFNLTLDGRGGGKIKHTHCKVSRCKNRHLAMGYCNTHYLRLKRHKKLTIDTLPPKSNRGCKIKYCKGKHDSKGYCGRHSASYKKYGRVRNRIRKLIKIGCKIKKCNAKHCTRGFCHNHYEAYRYYILNNRALVFYKRFKLKEAK